MVQDLSGKSIDTYLKREPRVRKEGKGWALLMDDSEDEEDEFLFHESDSDDDDGGV